MATAPATDQIADPSGVQRANDRPRPAAKTPQFTGTYSHNNMPPSSAIAAVQPALPPPPPSLNRATCTPPTTDPTPVAKSADVARKEPVGAMLVDGKLYDLKQLLGRGSFGMCHLYEHQATGHRVALKTMAREPQNGDEIAIHRQMVHPHIVRMLHELQNKHSYFIVMEPCQRSLHEHLNADRRPMAADRIRRLFAGALDALAYIHGKGYVHRDVKLANLLMRDENTLQICDFGLAAPVGSTAQLLCGTWSFLAPEAIAQSCPVHPALDVWSVAVCMYVCATRAPPFGTADRQETIRRIRLGIYVQRPLEAVGRPGVGRLLQLLERMFEPDFEKRLTVAQVHADGFFAGDAGELAEITGPTEQHLINERCRMRAINILQLLLGHKCARGSVSAPSAADRDRPRNQNVQLLNYRPVWLCKWTDYDDRQPYRMRYSLSDGHVGVLYADRTTIVRRAAKQLYHFDLVGDFVHKSSRQHTEFFAAVRHEQLSIFASSDALQSTVADRRDLVYVTGYMRMADVLVATLSNRAVQVEVPDRRFLLSPYTAHQIVTDAASDASGNRLGRLHAIDEDLPWAVLDELEKIVAMLRRIEVEDKDDGL